jgi:hypothetical protein
MLGPLSCRQCLELGGACRIPVNPTHNCRDAIPLTCLDNNAIAQLASPYGLSFRLIPIAQPRCKRNNGNYVEPVNLFGYFTSTAPAVVSEWGVVAADAVWMTGCDGDRAGACKQRTPRVDF